MLNLVKKITNLKGSLLAIAILGASSAASAQIAVNGAEVLRVGCGAQSNGCFAILADPVGPAACSSALVSFDGTTSSGKNVLAALMTIRAAGFTANLTISDTVCNGPNPSLIALTIN